MKFEDAKKIVQGHTILAHVRWASTDSKFRGRTGEVDKITDNDVVVVRFPRINRSYIYRNYAPTELDFIEKTPYETTTEESPVPISIQTVKDNWTRRRILAREYGYPGDSAAHVIGVGLHDIVTLRWSDSQIGHREASSLIFWYDPTDTRNDEKEAPNMFFVGDKVTVTGTIKSIDGYGIVASFPGAAGHLRFEKPEHLALMAPGVPSEPKDGTYVVIRSDNPFRSEAVAWIRDDQRAEIRNPDTMKTRYPKRWYRAGALTSDDGLSWPELQKEGQTEVIGRP